MNSTSSTRAKKSRLLGRVVDDKIRAEILELLDGTPGRRDLLIEYLHKIQDKYHCISKPHILALAIELNLPSTEIYEVATFYHHFDVVEDQAAAPPPITIRVCDSMTCELFGANQLIQDLKTIASNNIRIQKVPCVGRCNTAPVAVVGRNPVGCASKDKLYSAINDNNINAAIPDCINFDSYLQQGGYQILQKCINGEHSPAQIIKLLQDSGLRGLGGAGFPIGQKWQILQQQPGPRLIAINIDEGEPGTFKDRYYLERDPHRFLEGTLIAQWAIQAEEIYIYLRDEYAGCREMLEQELAALQSGSPCPLPPIHLRRGAGAYICGEESAMIESIEGKRGMPRLRPPYVAEVGLFGRPTLEQNMESMYWIRDIIEKGPQWFTSQGMNGRKGFRSFSVSGRVNKPGVHVAPAGITVRQLINEYCDGMLAGHKFYGYFPGGASGGILPASMDDIPLDFDTLQEHGCFIGSGAIIIFSNRDSAKAMALNAMRFFEHESCGQCTPCRVGTAKASILMQQKQWDRPLLEELAVTMEDASICGLGQAAPNPLRSVIKYFPEEFEQ